MTIRARHCWRAFPSGRPIRARGRRVSIRARHCWRAFPREVCTLAQERKFQSAPAIAGGRFRSLSSGVPSQNGFNRRPPLLAGVSVSVPFSAPTFEFQSAPAIAGGRFQKTQRLQQIHQSFNPRPPLLAGVSPQAVDPERPQAVSIRARHCWRAFPMATWGMTAYRIVSIRARHCWRAFHRWGDCIAVAEAFQSAPAIAGGRFVGCTGWLPS